MANVVNIGTRAMVMHGTALRTSGGLTQADLFYDKHGRIRSRRASAASRRNKNLGVHLLPRNSRRFVPGGATAR